MIRFIPFVLFLTIPLIEIALFITIGGQIGALATIGLVVLTAIIGATLLRQQGFQVLRTAQSDLDAGRMPMAQLGDAVFLAVAAVLLLTPGFLTDTLGLALFVPGVRRDLAARIWRWFKTAELRPQHADAQTRPKSTVIIDGEAVEVEQRSKTQTPKSAETPAESGWQHPPSK